MSGENENVSIGQTEETTELRYEKILSHKGFIILGDDCEEKRFLVIFKNPDSDYLIQCLSYVYADYELAKFVYDRAIELYEQNTKYKRKCDSDVLITTSILVKTFCDYMENKVSEDE